MLTRTKTSYDSFDAALQERVDLLEAEIPHLRRYARFLTNNFHLADDMVQDCLVRAIENIDKWAPGTNLRAWLTVILRNNFFNHCRRRRRDNDIKFDPGLAAANVAPPAQDDMVLLRELAVAFGELSRDHQEVICLIVVEGMSYEDVAATLDVSVGTVKSRLSRGRRELRQIMDGQVHVQAVRRAANPTQAPNRATAEMEAHFDRLLTSSEVSEDRRPLAA